MIAYSYVQMIYGDHMITNESLPINIHFGIVYFLSAR